MIMRVRFGLVREGFWVETWGFRGGYFLDWRWDRLGLWSGVVGFGGRRVALGYGGYV